MRFKIKIIVFLIVLCFSRQGFAQSMGSIRGMVYDSDFDVPLPAAEISIAETREKTTATEEGNYIFKQIIPGNYTLVFSKDGYERKIKSNVLVLAGQMTDADASLSGEFTEMEEFVVQDLQIGATEAGLLMLRIESPALLDSISSDLLSRAGAGDAASALNLVAGATVQDGKFAVIRGLPDRYVNSQINGVRVPSADPDKRAVQLDQFPSAVIENIQVSKTFTPDQQGDASGGAVNIMLKGIPEKSVFDLKIGTGVNSQVLKSDQFLTYEGGGVNLLGIDDGRRDIPDNEDFSAADRMGDAVGISWGDAPINYNLGLTVGGKHEFDNEIKVGGFTSLYYQRNSSFYDDKIDDSYWVDTPEEQLTPKYQGGGPNHTDPEDGDFITSLFDITQASQEVKWGGLATVGIEIEDHSLNLLYMYTRVAEDTATLAEDTRGKEYYFPGYDLNDPTHPGNGINTNSSAPYIRQETLKYEERTTDTLQLNGKHELSIIDKIGLDGFFAFTAPQTDWTMSWSSSALYEPDKRQFGQSWKADYYYAGFPPWIPPSTNPAAYYPYKPGANINFGNFQRTWQDIEENSEQYSINLKFPFEQWTEDKGYLKLGVFKDHVERDFNQDSYSNFNQTDTAYPGGWEESFSAGFMTWPSAFEITASDLDVDYHGEQEISAWYYMADFPLNSFLRFIGGMRYEDTAISIVNDAEPDATFIAFDNNNQEVKFSSAADAAINESHALPALGVVINPLEKITLRGSYSRTIARQTFKELSPIQQQEYLGGDIFIGNQNLKMSGLENYDLRLDYTPYAGGLISFSWFRKDIKDPIEYIQSAPNTGSYSFITPVNFPEGQMSGYEMEIRQKIGDFIKPLEGLSLGANATFIDSSVELSESQKDIMANMEVDISSRPMLNAPEHLYNFNLTYDLETTGTKFGLFYTVKGDTLVAGAGRAKGNFIPDIYAKEYATLNMSISQKLGKIGKMEFKAGNLLDPKIEEVFRSDVTEGETIKTSYTKGIDYSLSLSFGW